MNEKKSFLVDLAETIDRRLPQRNAQQDASSPRPGRLRRLLRWLAPNGGTLLLIAVLVLTQRVWARPLAAPAAAPGPSATTVNYQGRLADSSGNPLSGSYGMTFALYDASIGGNLVWGPESHAAVPVSDGLFSVGLGSQTDGGIPTSVWGGDRYLEITVGGETLSPRELIRSVPVAGMALTVPDGSIVTEKLADGAVTADKASGFAVAEGGNVLIQYAKRHPATSNTTTIVFPQPFAGTPTVVAIADTNGAQNVTVRGISSTQFTVDVPGTSGNLAINWIAIGPAS